MPRTSAEVQLIPKYLLITALVVWATGCTAPTSTPTPAPTPSAGGKTYYLSPTGSDNNSGTSASAPWKTPNHNVNCGDVILALLGAYSGISSFGTVNCPAGNNVAWLACQTFDTCKISGGGISVHNSFWGVEGFEVDNGGACFSAAPSTSTTTIHHIIFANNVANGCQSGGFGSAPFQGAKGPSGVDYLVLVGNLAYNGAQSSAFCFSGISLYEPANSDTAAGTHMYLAQNISWANVEPSTCAGGNATDGEGIILDTFNGSQSPGMPVYSGQTVVENNILIGNGSRGFEVFNNTSAPIISRFNTTYGNGTSLHVGEFVINVASLVTVKNNIAQATNGPGIEINAVSNSVINFDWFDAASGQKTRNDGGGTTISFGTSNTLGVNPGFPNPVIPGAPNCSGTANTLACMASTVAGFTPTASGASAFGYQPVTSTFSSNSEYPAWLCNVSMPAGIISNYCN